MLSTQVHNIYMCDESTSTTTIFFLPESIKIILTFHDHVHDISDIIFFIHKHSCNDDKHENVHMIIKEVQ